MTDEAKYENYKFSFDVEFFNAFCWACNRLFDKFNIVCPNCMSEYTTQALGLGPHIKRIESVEVIIWIFHNPCTNEVASWYKINREFPGQRGIYFD